MAVPFPRPTCAPNWVSRADDLTPALAAFYEVAFEYITAASWLPKGPSGVWERPQHHVREDFAKDSFVGSSISAWDVRHLETRC